MATLIGRMASALAAIGANAAGPSRAVTRYAWLLAVASVLSTPTSDQPEKRRHISAYRGTAEGEKRPNCAAR
jgi:hypothetical protein